MQKFDAGCTSGNTSLPANLRMRNTEGNRFQKLLKEELRMTIMAKRRARGEEELKVDFPEPESHEMTGPELERRERRREQNRRAAQRCRRKKRMNQMSVLQNYEWIITHNQQLQQEVEQLRQEMRDMHSVLKAHQDACSCTHTPKAPLPAMATTPKVKVEPGNPASPSTASVSSDYLPASCQFSSAGSTDSLSHCGLAPTAQQAYSSVQARGYQALPYSGPGFAVTPAPSGGGGGYHPAENNGHAVPAMMGNGHNNNHLSNPHNTHQHHHSQGATAGVHGLQPVGGFPGMTAPYSSPPLGQQAPLSGGGQVSVLDELAYLPGGLRACTFQQEAATPLSSDGRRSISSVSSDVSSASEPRGRDVAMTSSEGPAAGGLGVADLYMADDGAPSDVSQLLSQINQNDLIFQANGHLDEVFSDGMGPMPDHFLQM